MHRILSVPALLLFALIALAAPARAFERQTVDSAVRAPGGLARTAPISMRWTAPDNTRLWARAEGPPRSVDDHVVRGVISMGQRVEVLDCADQGIAWCNGLRLNMTPQIRAVPDAPSRNGGQTPTVGFGLAQSLDLDVTRGFHLRAGLDIGDRLGVAAPLAPGNPGVVMKARAGFGADLRQLGFGVPLRVDASLVLIQEMGGTPSNPRPSDCEGAFDLKLATYAPLRITVPCGTSRAPRFGFGIRGEF